MIDSLHNFSLVGSDVNNTLIECSTPSLIAIINCTNTVIKNITTGSQCGSLVKPYYDILHHMVIFISKRILNPSFIMPTPIKTHTAIYIFNSYSTTVHSVLTKTYGIFVINGLGNTTLTDIALYHGDLEIFYIYIELMTIQRYSNHTLQIIKFQYCGNKTPKNFNVPKSLLYAIMIEFWQEYYNTEVYIKDSIFQSLKRIELMSISFLHSSLGKHLVTIEQCQFLNNSGVSQNNNSGVITVMYPWCPDASIDGKWMNAMNKIQVFDSNFIKNTAYHKSAIIFNLYLFGSHYEISHFTISNCSFAMNSNFSVLTTASLVLGAVINELSGINPGFVKMVFEYNIVALNVTDLLCTIRVHNSVFIQTGSGKDITVMHFRNAVLKLYGPLVLETLEVKLTVSLLLKQHKL